MSWAQKVAGSLPSSWNKNILEIELEKDKKGAFNVRDNDVARVMRKIGLDRRPGVQVETVQICPNGRGVIYITVKNGIDIGRFCRYDIIDVTSEGVRAVHVKAAGKREVVIHIRGLQALNATITGIACSPLKLKNTGTAGLLEQAETTAT